MKKNFRFALAFAWLLGSSAAQAQGFIQLGTIFVEDQAHRMIATSDGGYITAGSAGPKAVLYKTDCTGNLVAQIEKTYTPGPAVFWDVTELADGSIVAVGGGSTFSSAIDSAANVILLKTTPMLVEIANSNFLILDKGAQGKSIAQTPTGQLLVWGEVAGFSVDFTDAFFQRVNPNTLQPSAAPVIFNDGVDLASRIIPTADTNYLLTGSSFFGNIFDPEAPIDNNLRAYKVDENGVLLWQAAVNQVFKAKYGVARVCGAGQNTISGNFTLGGTLFGGTDEREQDAVFALIGNDGTVLDTTYGAALGQQQYHVIIGHQDLVGLFTMLGESEGSPLGVPSFALAQAYEVGDVFVATATFNDPANPVSLRGVAQIDPGRFAYMGTLPDNPQVLGATDIIIVTPAAVVGLVYQNCALAPVLTTPAVAFQWVYEEAVIPGANQGVYFPDQPGLYRLQVLDDKGCYGISDTFRVNGVVADFTYTEDDLTVIFSDASVGADEYFWMFGDGENSILQNPAHTYAANGVYNVVLIAQTECGIADTVFQQIGVVPTNEPSWRGHFVLSPNPTSGTFTIEMSGERQEKVEFALFNSVGQLAQREEVSFKSGLLQKTFDIGHLPAGVYSLQIRSGKEAKNVKVVRR
ncbi:MAG: PKD domain-containing protein [Saprospiraceae bacterium]